MFLPRALTRKSAGMVVLLCMATAGCISRPALDSVRLERLDNAQPASRALETLGQLYPNNYRATHRAILKFGSKEFAFDAVLHVSEHEGHHLAVISSFGTVTDLRINPNGECEILKATPLFRESWARQYIARDLAVLFAPPRGHGKPNRTDDGQIVLEFPFEFTGKGNEFVRYFFDHTGSTVQAIELIRSGRTFYRATVSNYKTVPGWPSPVPSQFEVIGGKYRLDLRVVEIAVLAESAGGGRK